MKRRRPRAARLAQIVKAGMAAGAYTKLDPEPTGVLISAVIHETADAILAGADRALVPFLGPVALAVTADRWYIPFEEAALQQKFGERYEAYTRATRRWI